MPSRLNNLSCQTPIFKQVGNYRIELLPREAYEVAFVPQQTIIGFAFESQSGFHAFASDRKIHYRTKPNSLAYVPNGCEVYSTSNQGGEYLVLKIPNETLQPTSGQHRFSNWIDQAAIEAAQRLRNILLLNIPIDSLAVEFNVSMLKDRVLSALDDAVKEPRMSQWITAHRLKMIDEIIEANLDKKLTVESLANQLGLSSGFFSRAFKAAVGKPPHDYIINRRISRARLLLHSKKLDINIIAHIVGFSSHAHMTTVFKNRLGITPSAIKKTTD